MKILHYFLGFPPYRSGVLTKYSYDLMEAQSEDDNGVIALWPGQIGIFSRKVCMKKRAAVKGIENYELMNPLPVALDEGIKDFEAYMRSCDRKIYVDFLEHIKPDVIHIHTLMGLHKEFIDAAEDLKIKKVFTTHDYFGICPKVTLYKNSAPCEDDCGCRECIRCNDTALSFNKIRIMQSCWYRHLKDFAIVKQLRRRHRRIFFAKESMSPRSMKDDEAECMAREYKRLRAYYIYMLEHMDIIHFNSSVAELIYKKYMVPRSSRVMTITHKNIKDNRDKIRWKPSDRLRITLLAPANSFKGFDVLKNALDELWNTGKKNFELKIFSPVKDPAPYMIVKENGFDQNELDQIFSETDVLTAPSVWYETFGFTVLEALSYGVPVIVSDHVGAKDIVGNGGLVLEAGNNKELKKALDETDFSKLRENIKQMASLKQWKEFVQDNYNLYRR